MGRVISVPFFFFVINMFCEFKKHYWERWMYDPWRDVLWELGFHAIGALLIWNAIGGLLLLLWRWIYGMG